MVNGSFISSWTVFHELSPHEIIKQISFLKMCILEFLIHLQYEYYINTV